LIEKKAREEAERKVAEINKAGSNLQLQYQQQSQYVSRLEAQIKENQESFQNSMRSAQQSHEQLQKALTKEQENRSIGLFCLVFRLSSLLLLFSRFLCFVYSLILPFLFASSSSRKR